MWVIVNIYIIKLTVLPIEKKPDIVCEKPKVFAGKRLKVGVENQKLNL